MGKFAIQRIWKFIQTYRDRIISGLLLMFSLFRQLQAVAIISGVVLIIGISRFKEFIENVLKKIEESKEGSLWGTSWKKTEQGVLPQEELIKMEKRSGVLPEFYTYSEQGNIFLQQGDIKKAKEMFEKAEIIEPGNFNVQVALGLIYNILKENKKSVDYSKKALEIKPDSFIPRFNLAIATNHLFGYIKSLPEYLRAEKIAERLGIGETIVTGKLNLFLGHDYRDSGERKEALLRYEKAQRIFEIYKSIPEASFWLNDTKSEKRKVELRMTSQKC
ncbi:MAG: hypothetical protein KKE55_02685 [Candidatus Omnitrophica bacterium]|nr:hypothetical protein [Candidatus Omnitrophota bacterium]MBU1524036.1 hypothetical protein [Candidatus Omnitrophota bacterium]MBU2436587.1 hypothetical protein [Candidatus Omnitrophota bacterium]